MHTGAKDKVAAGISDKILFLSMKYGAYDAVRDKCKKHEFRDYGKYHSRIEKGGYTEILMFRGHCYDYINNPWMRITYNNEWTVLNPKPSEPIFAGPYCDGWMSEAITKLVFKISLGNIIEEGGPLYRAGPPYFDITQRQKKTIIQKQMKDARQLPDADQIDKMVELSLKNNKYHSFEGEVFLVTGNVHMPFYDETKVEKALRKFINNPKNGVAKLASSDVTEVLTDYSHRDEKMNIEPYWTSSVLNPVREMHQSAVNVAKNWALSTLKTLQLSIFKDVSVHQVSNISFLLKEQSRAGTKHVDSQKSEFFVLECLSSDVPPFEYCDPNTYSQTTFDFVNFLVPKLSSCSEADLASLKSCTHFQCFKDLCRPQAELDKSITPAVRGRNWTVGDLVLCRGDIIHRNPAFSKFRQVLFFTISAPTSLHRYSFSDQYTAYTVLWDIVTFMRFSEGMVLCDLVQCFLRAVYDYKDHQPWVRYEGEEFSGFRAVIAAVCQSENVDQALIDNLTNGLLCVPDLAEIMQQKSISVDKELRYPSKETLKKSSEMMKRLEEKNLLV